MYTEEQLNQMPTKQLRKIMADIETKAGYEVLRGRSREMLIDDILDHQEKKGGSGHTL